MRHLRDEEADTMTEEEQEVQTEEEPFTEFVGAGARVDEERYLV